MILSFSNFNKGLHDPAVCKIKSSSNGYASIDTEFMTLQNMFPKRDGSLVRRGGLTSVANLKTGSAASTSFIANKGMFWHPGLSKWLVAASTGQLYEVTEGTGTSPGAVLKMIDVARNRMTVAWSDTSHDFYELAGQSETIARVTSAGVYSYGENPGRAGFLWERGNYWCRTYYIAGISSNYAYTQVDVSGVIYITPGAVTVPTVMGGSLPYNNYLLLIKADGKVFRYSGVTASDASLIQIGGNLGDPVLYTLTDCSPYGLMFTTKNNDYLIYRVPQIDNEIDLMSVTDDKFDTPLTDGIDNDATTSSALVVFDSNCAPDATATAISSNASYPASYLNDADITTAWNSDNDLTTGKTATASTEDGAQVAGLAIDNNTTTYWKSTTTGGTASVYWRVDLTAGQIVKGLKIMGNTTEASPFGPGATWNLQGSNDNFATAGVTLTKTLIAGNYYEITNTTSFRYYQVIGDTTDRGAGVFYADAKDICLLTYGAAGTTNWIQLDWGAGVTKTIKKVRLYRGTVDTEPFYNEVFKISTNGTDWTTLTSDLTQSVQETGSWYYWDYYFNTNTTAARYLKVEFTYAYSSQLYYEYAGFLHEILTYETTTATDTDTGKKSGACWHPGTMERYRWITKTDSKYYCHVYSPKNKRWWQFDTGSFGGSMAVKNGDLYLTTNQYTISSTLYPSGIYKLRTDGLGSDPDAAFTCKARAGWLEFDGIYRVRNIYVKGKGLTTFNIYWEYDNPEVESSGTHTKTITDLKRYQWAPEGSIECDRLSWEAIGSVGIADTTKEVEIEKVLLDVEFVRDFTGARSRK